MRGIGRVLPFLFLTEHIVQILHKIDVAYPSNTYSICGGRRTIMKALEGIEDVVIPASDN